MSQRPSCSSNTFVTKASKLKVLPSLRSSSTFSMPTAHATFPLVRTWDSAKEIVTRVELAEAHVPSLPDAVPADHNCRAERTDERRVGRVRPHFVHRANITRGYRRNERPTCSLHPVDIRRILNFVLAESAGDGHSCRQQECCKRESSDAKPIHGVLLTTRSNAGR